MFFLASLITFVTWFVVHDDVRVRQPHTLDSTPVRITVYAPIEQNQQCRRTNDAPVFRDLEPAVHL